MNGPDLAGKGADVASLTADDADAPFGSPYLPRIAETHTGLVILLGEFAYKLKKPVTTDFLDFSTPAAREQACAHEVTLNRRLAPASYLGVGHFHSPGDEPPEPVIVMRRHPDERRLATLVHRGDDVTGELAAIAELLARFHAGADRGPQIDAEARRGAVTTRWQNNLTELARYADGAVPGLDPQLVAKTASLATAFAAGRAALFDGRISDGRIVDGHADLLADDIFCLPDGPELLDCLEFDDRLRYVDGVDDAAFLAMDLHFLGRGDLAEEFLGRYLAAANDDAPQSLQHFYIAYRAGVRAKVDCVRYTQGHPEAAADAQRHLGVALAHLHAAAVRLVLVGGAPGTGKTTLARGLAKELAAEVISTDDVRATMAAGGEISGEPGVLGEGLYAPENIAAVYVALLSAAQQHLGAGRTVILDGTWSDPHFRDQTRVLAAETHSAMVEFTCVTPLNTSVERIRTRTHTTSQVTPDIAAALAGPGQTVSAGPGADWPQAHRIDTTRPPADAVAEALQILRTP
jgi:aminoglycoside phosphotransferase family enzyme/predicted kinase